MSGLTAFKAVRVVGTVLPHEALPRAAELRMPGQHASDYQLPPGMAVNAAIARAWEAMLAAHQQLQQALGRLPDTHQRGTSTFRRNQSFGARRPLPADSSRKDQ